MKLRLKRIRELKREAKMSKILNTKQLRSLILNEVKKLKEATPAGIAENLTAEKLIDRLKSLPSDTMFLEENHGEVRPIRDDDVKIRTYNLEDEEIDDDGNPLNGTYVVFGAFQ